MKLYYDKKYVEVQVKKLSFLGRATGLMFKTPSTENLLFDFSRDSKASITSWFVFFPFLAVWLDDKNNILEWKLVDPFVFRIVPRNLFRRLVEIPINKNNEKIIKFIVGKRKGLNRPMIRNS
ncbi:DUF192 domain-containing protein [Candidatus Pacearchaeota archaeon]|nr:DUF192 domain-containing protein [Candidatus Pacearchaeota archaeon]